MWFALTNCVFLLSTHFLASRRMWLVGTDNEETPDSKWPSWNKWFIRIWERFCPIRNLFLCCSHPLRQQHQAPPIALSSQLSFGTAGEIWGFYTQFWSTQTFSRLLKLRELMYLLMNKAYIYYLHAVSTSASLSWWATWETLNSRTTGVCQAHVHL